MGNHCPCFISQMGRLFLELVGCMVAELKNPVITGALFLRQNRHPGNEFDRFPAVTCIIVPCASYRKYHFINFHGFSVSSSFRSLPLLVLILTIFQSRRNCGWLKRDCWKRDFQYLLVNQLIRNNEKGRSPLPFAAYHRQIPFILAQNVSKKCDNSRWKNLIRH